MSIIWEHHGSSVDGTLIYIVNYTVNYIMNYIMDCNINYTNARKQIKQVVVNLAQVNKRFNPVKVLRKASHCRISFKIHMIRFELICFFFSFSLSMMS